MREAEKPIQRKNEIGGPGGGSLLPCLSCWADENRGEKVNQREWETERGGEHRLERKVRFLGIWVVLFVLICDCFVVNILDRICSLSGWFLVCLEDNNVWFTKIFVFLVKRMCQIFVIHLKLNFLFPYSLLFSKILGPSFHSGALGNCLTRLREGLALDLILMPLIFRWRW